MRRRKPGEQWSIKHPDLKRGVTVRGIARPDGSPRYLCRLRIHGRQTKRALAEARTDAQAVKAANLVLASRDAEEATASTDVLEGADEGLVELLAAARAGVSSYQWMAQAEALIAERIAAAVASPEPDEPLSWEEATERYLAALADNHKRESTIASYRRQLRWIGQGCGPHLSTLDADGLEALWRDIAQRSTEAGHASATLAKRRRELLAFLRWARRRHLPKGVTTDEINDSLARVEVTTEGASPIEPGAEIRDLLKAVARRDAGVQRRDKPVLPLVAFLLATGARMGEAVEARWEEFSADCTRWTIPASRVKTKKKRVVGLEVRPEVLAMLRRMKLATGGKGYLFPGRRKGQPMERSGTSKLMGRIQDAYGGPRFTPQRLRQTAAAACCNWSRLGPVAAARRLGHSSEERWRSYLDGEGMTERYVGETLEEALGVAGLLGQLLGWEGAEAAETARAAS